MSDGHSAICFLLTPTQTARQIFRRFVYSMNRACAGVTWGCEAWVEVGDVPWLEAHDGSGAPPSAEERVDPRWPTKCARCGQPFREEDEWQVRHARLFARSDGGAPVTTRDAPPGAMYERDCVFGEHCAWSNCTGKHLYAVCPGGSTWDVDSRASNCTMPDDRVHRCWVRHGEAPRLMVDKAGLTCNAGAGSIQISNWHGFLRDGVLAP